MPKLLGKNVRVCKECGERVKVVEHFTSGAKFNFCENENCWRGPDEISGDHLPIPVSATERVLINGSAS